MDKIEYGKILCALTLTANTICRRYPDAREQTDRILQLVDELKPIASDAVLGEVAIDSRIYYSSVSDMIIGSWSKDERRAMMYIAGQIYNNYKVLKK